MSGSASALVADVVEAAGAGAGDACRELARRCAEETARDHRLLAHCASGPRIVELVGEVRDALGAAGFPDDDVAGEAKLLRARLGYLPGERRERKGRRRGRGRRDACPRRRPPGAGPASRHVFEKAEAAFFVSATLAAPSASPHPNDLLRAFGIAPGTKTPARINYAGWNDLQPRRYGRMRFRFADRSVPGPFRRGEDDSAEADPAHLRYVASAVEEARKSGRVLVLCTSYALAEELGSRVEAAIVTNEAPACTATLDAFRTAPDSVLLTPAAWAGSACRNGRPPRHPAHSFPAAHRGGRSETKLPVATGVGPRRGRRADRGRPERGGSPKAGPGHRTRHQRAGRKLHPVDAGPAISPAEVDGTNDRRSGPGQGGEPSAVHQLHPAAVPKRQES